MGLRSVTDDSSRPGRTMFEIPLSSTDTDTPGLEDAPAPPPNWRKTAGLSALAGVALGIVAAVVIGASDEEPVPSGATDPTTTPAPDSVSAFATIPAATPPSATAPATTVVRTPDERSIGDLTALTVIPDFATLPDALAVDTIPVDFARAVVALGDDIARQGTTSYQWLDRDRSMRVVIRRDPVNDRDLITLPGPDRSATVLVDHAGDVIYTSDPDRTDESVRWIRRAADDVLDGSGLTSLRQLVSPMMLGPIRPDTVAGATVTDTGEHVDLGDSTVARRFVVTMPTETIPEWVTYLFGPGWGEPRYRPGLPSVAALDVYVSEAGAIEVVTGRFLIDGAASGFVHRIDTIAEPEPIALPDPASVNDAPG